MYVFITIYRNCCLSVKKIVFFSFRVNNLRMAYGLYEGMDKKCTETKGFDELAELCRMMMKSIEVNKNLWAAMVCTVRSVKLVQ